MLPGLRPATLAAPVGIGFDLQISGIILNVPIEPYIGISYWGRGREGVKSLPVYVFPLFFKNMQDFLFKCLIGPNIRGF